MLVLETAAHRPLASPFAHHSLRPHGAATALRFQFADVLLRHALQYNGVLETNRSGPYRLRDELHLHSPLSQIRGPRSSALIDWHCVGIASGAGHGCGGVLEDQHRYESRACGYTTAVGKGPCHHFFRSVRGVLCDRIGQCAVVGQRVLGPGGQGRWDGDVDYGLLYVVPSFLVVVGLRFRLEIVRAMLTSELIGSSNILVSATFLSLVSAISASGAFGLYAGVCFVGWVFIIFTYPETAGLGLESVRQVFEHGFGVRYANQLQGLRWIDAAL